MSEEKADGLFSLLKDAYRSISTVTAFILANGFVIAVIAFGVLHYTLGDIKSVEARNVTRELLRTAEQAIASTEKTVRGLGYFYSSFDGSTQADGGAAANIHKLLADDTQVQAILWVTDDGTWLQQDFVKRTMQDSFDPKSGWPDYQSLYRETLSHDYNTINYMQSMPWVAFSTGVQRAPEQNPVGLTMKLRMPDGTIGILLAVTTPQNIFGDVWSVQRKDILGVSVHDKETGNRMFGKYSSTIRKADNGLSKYVDAALLSVDVSYVLQMGNKMWDIRFEVVPSTGSSILAASSGIVLALILSLVCMAAASAERRYRQDIKLAQMSKNLEGAHTELQSRISERDKLFHALRKSERENRAVINSVSDVIFETDEIGRLVFLNETWKRITDIEPGATIGQSLFDKIDADDRGRQREMFEELVRGERQAYRSETNLDLGHGMHKPIEIAFSMVRMAEDKSIRIVGTITDIEKRRRAELAVRDAEQRFRAIFENSISGIYQTSPEGRFISANPALAEILGYASTEDLIMSVTDISKQIYVRSEERKAFVQKILFEGRVSEMETEVMRKDGKKIWIMENARVVRSERGGVQYYEGSIWDVTERKEAEEAMRQARMQAEISSRSRMEFLANMSHELRTPLNAIIGFSEIIKDEIMGSIGQPVYKEYAKDIYDSGNYLLKVISEILEVSKIETGNRELTASNFRLTKALKSCMTIMSNRMDEAGVEVTMDVPDTLPEILAEELGFKQIMLNVVGNAIKFTPKGGKVNISARLTEIGEMVIDVTDTGIGMSDAEILVAMQPFSKVDHNFSTMKAGTGLGLTIVDSLVRLHGGQFKLISQKGVGTTARIILPPFRVLHTDGLQAPQLKVVK